jgi:ABC-type branched-subunit amino acid transport system ATPase component
MTDTTKTEAALKREAYGAATTRLREQHRDDFNTLLVEENRNRGIDWKPKPTEEQKAAEQFAQLFATYPELAKQIANQA